MRTTCAYLWLIAVVVAMSATIFAASYGGGSGTAEDPYQIWTPEQMNTIGVNPSDWDKHFKLMTDIDMSVFTGTQYKIIGNSKDPFTGTFDGSGHVISNLTYSTTEAIGSLGVFGRTNNAAIQNLGVENVSLSSSGDHIGGLVGYNAMGTLSGCYATGSVSGTATTYVGGGLVGYNLMGTITGCYATSSINGVGWVGGLVGYNSMGTINGCYAAGLVNGIGWVGGFIGIHDGGVLTDCFWDIQTSDTTNGTGNLNANLDPNNLVGFDTEMMMTRSTFTSAGWDFVGESSNGTADMWRMCVDGISYPRLAWEFSFGGDFACPDGADWADLYYLAQRWMAITPEGIGAADGNLDGKVDIVDFAFLSANWIPSSPQIGSLRVTISPQGAIDAGAQWRREGTGEWFNSGDTESGIPVGVYTVEFKSVEGWNAPEKQSITIENNQMTNAGGNYTPILLEGLIAHWTMDDNAANKTVLDAGENHLNGAAQQNTSALTVAGKVSTALAFNGKTDWIDCGTNPALLPDAWTLCAWIRCDNVMTPMLISFGGNYPSIKLQNSSDGKSRIHLGQFNYRYFAASGWTTLKDGQWHHVAFTVPGKAQADIGQAMMYVDGVAVDGDAPVMTGVQAAKTHVYLGANPAIAPQRFGGAMDDVMMFNRVLSADEIDAIINRVP